MWKYKCDCSTEVECNRSNVRTGHTESCGCYMSERRIESHTTHGDNRKGNIHHLYSVWCGMKARCENENSPGFHLYGGRGIGILWNRYEDFKHDMIGSYRKGLQIERIDNNGSYCKENCRWATPRENCLNKRNNIRVTINGETLCISQWAERSGIKRATLENRFHSGCPHEMLLTPQFKRGKSPVKWIPLSTIHDSVTLSAMGRF